MFVKTKTQTNTKNKNAQNAMTSMQDRFGEDVGFPNKNMYVVVVATTTTTTNTNKYCCVV
jgi:predicted AAA+ superfamily ATPase